MIEINSNLLIEDLSSYQIGYSDVLPVLIPYIAMLSSLLLWRLGYLDIRAMRSYQEGF